MSDLTSILPQLSVGVIAVLSLVFVTVSFLKQMSVTATLHERAMNEREMAMRTLERQVREEFARLLTHSTHVISENTKILARAIDRLDRDK